jgi:sulfite reductase (NADPH) hemoprotein beta-component
MAHTVSTLAVERHFTDEELRDIGELSINISGCMNACGHHHVGNIGILGVDKKGQEFYQVSLGGKADNDAALGKIIGPAFSQEEIPGVIARIVDVYQENRREGERFIDTFARLDIAPFKEKVYAKDH